MKVVWVLGSGFGNNGDQLVVKLSLLWPIFIQRSTCLDLCTLRLRPAPLTEGHKRWPGEAIAKIAQQCSASLDLRG